MGAVRAIRATVSGRVQGVGFRYSTVSKAHELGVTGWVRNAANGTVEVHGQGTPDDVEAFLAYLRAGPMAARVAGVTVVSVTADPDLEGFGVRA